MTKDKACMFVKYTYQLWLVRYILWRPHTSTINSILQLKLYISLTVFLCQVIASFHVQGLLLLTNMIDEFKFQPSQQKAIFNMYLFLKKEMLVLCMHKNTTRWIHCQQFGVLKSWGEDCFTNLQLGVYDAYSCLCVCAQVYMRKYTPDVTFDV